MIMEDKLKHEILTPEGIIDEIIREFDNIDFNKKKTLNRDQLGQVL